MRIVINGRFLTQSVTGIQRFGHEATKALDRLLARGELGAGDEVLLIAPRNIKYEIPLRNIRLQTAGAFTGHLWEQLELPWLARDAILLNLCQIGPCRNYNQLVVMHDASTYAIPWAFSRRFRLWYRVLMPMLARFSRELVTVSRFSKTELERYLHLPPDRLRVVYEGSEHILSAEPDATILARHALRPGRFVLAVSSLNPNKNFRAVAEAIPYLNDADFEVVIAGGADPRVFGVAALPCGVKYLGYVSDGELRALYENAGCFVFPSFYEGFGLPPLEAMRCGCPVIASRAASMPEVCGDAAVYCDPASPQDIASKIRSVMQDEQRGQLLAATGRVHAARFDWEVCARQLWDAALGKQLIAAETK
jgi:glycosyltransferase involved in cell wall biosynthesis